MKALVIFSGGLDSTTAVYWALKKYKNVETLSQLQQVLRRAKIVM